MIAPLSPSNLPPVPPLRARRAATPPHPGWVAGALVALVVAVGCSGDDDPEAASLLLSPADLCETALVCEGFDSMPVGMAPGGVWTNNQNNGTVAVDAARSFSGTQALLAATPTSDIAYKAALAGYQDPAVLPTADNAHYGRVMVYLEAAPETEVHWTFLAGAGQSPPQLGYPDGADYPTGFEVLYRYGGQKVLPGGSQLMASYETPGFYATPPSGPDTDCHQDSDAVPMPQGRWTCAEWHFDGNTDEMQLWIDGTEVSGLHVVGNGARCRTLADDLPWTAPSFRRIDLGWESYQPDTERLIWVDDFVLDTQRIGCPPPL